MSNILSQNISELQIPAGDSIYIYPHVPLKKVTNALKSYGGSLVSPEQVLILVDDTFFGSAKNGIMVTDQAIYTKPSSGKPIQINIDDIKSISHNNKILLVNGHEFAELKRPKQISIDKIYKFLEKYIDASDKSPTDSKIQETPVDSIQPNSEEFNLKNLENAASRGNIDAQFSLAQYYFDQSDIENSTEKAFYWFEKAAKKGNSDIKYDLAISYDQDNNEEKAFYWYKKAAEEGNKEAQLDLGLAYMLGKGIEPDEFEGHKWFKKAAENGNIAAMWSLGKSYLDGDGTEQNDRKAFYWFRKGAENDEPMAQNSLGICYLRGRGTDIDKHKAFYWVKKAAENGEKIAQGNLGDYYRKGTGTPVDMDKARFWYQKAAEQGDRYSEEAIVKYFSNTHISTNSVTSQRSCEDKDSLPSRPEDSRVDSSSALEYIKGSDAPVLFNQNRLRTNSKFSENLFKHITRLNGYELLLVAFLRNNAGDKILNILSKLPLLGIPVMVSKWFLRDPLQWFTDQFVEYGEQFVMGRIVESWREKNITYEQVLSKLDTLNSFSSFFPAENIIEDSKMLLDRYYNSDSADQNS